MGAPEGRNIVILANGRTHPLVLASNSHSPGIALCRPVLKLYPSAEGMRHDETRGWVFRFAQKINRKIAGDATLHPSAASVFLKWSSTI